MQNGTYSFEGARYNGHTSNTRNYFIFFGQSIISDTPILLQLYSQILLHVKNLNIINRNTTEFPLLSAEGSIEIAKRVEKDSITAPDVEVELTFLKFPIPFYLMIVLPAEFFHQESKSPPGKNLPLAATFQAFSLHYSFYVNRYL